MSFYRSSFDWVAKNTRRVAGKAAAWWNRLTGALLRSEKSKMRARKARERSKAGGLKGLGARLQSMGWQMVNLISSALTYLTVALGWVAIVAVVAVVVVLLTTAIILATAFDIAATVVMATYDLWVSLADLITMGVALPVLGAAVLVHAIRIRSKSADRPDKEQMREVSKKTRPTFRTVMRPMNKIFAPLSLLPFPVLVPFVGWSTATAQASTLIHRYEDQPALKVVQETPEPEHEPRRVMGPEPTIRVTEPMSKEEADKVVIPEVDIVIADEHMTGAEEGPYVIDAGENEFGFDVTICADERTYRVQLPAKPDDWENWDLTPHLHFARAQDGRHMETGEPLNPQQKARWQEAVEIAAKHGIDTSSPITWEGAKSKSETSYLHGRAYARNQWAANGENFLKNPKAAWAPLAKSMQGNPELIPRRAKEGFNQEIELIEARLAVR